MAHHDPIGLIAPHAGLAQLNERSRDIFRQIVESYLATGEPVGSRNISRLIAMPLSPASVRNVMSDLEQLGLIYAPHTSAGRLPTELGLRFFVDALMQVGDLTEPEREVDPEPACLRRPGAIGRGGARRSLDAAVRPDPGRGRGADRQIQFAAEAHRIRAAGAGARAGGAGRRRRPGRKPRADAAARRAVLGADGSDQLPQCADSRADAGRSAARARNRADAEPRRTRSADAEGDRGRHRELVRRRQRRPAIDRARPRQSARRPARAGGSRARANRCSTISRPSAA